MPRSNKAKSMLKIRAQSRPLPEPVPINATYASDDISLKSYPFMATVTCTFSVP